MEQGQNFDTRLREVEEWRATCKEKWRTQALWNTKMEGQQDSLRSVLWKLVLLVVATSGSTGLLMKFIGAI